jgi:hypothetical protein
LRDDRRFRFGDAKNPKHVSWPPTPAVINNDENAKEIV